MMSACMSTSLPYVDEPMNVKRSLNEASSGIREATLRQASDIATPVYHTWKDQLMGSGLTWQVSSLPLP